MRPISNEFSNALLENSTLLVKATLRLADGTVRELTGDDVVDLSVEQATSSDGGFDIGACVIGKCDVTLNNHDRRFDAYDFAGSTIAPHVGKSLPSGATEWVPLGTFYADQPDAYGGTIAISCLDGMSLLERGIDGVTLTGATMASAISNICAKCGIPYDDGSMSRHISTNATITATFDDRTSCLDVMSSICQYHGCFGRIANGRLTFGWYDTAALEGESWLNGGVLDDGRPYSTGAVADGGSLSDYATGDRADGGGFDGNGSVAHLFNCTSLSVSTDDVVVTGIEVTAQDKEEAGDGQQSVAGETVLSGTKGYVLSIDGNRLVACGTAGEVASRVADGIVGMRFRPFAANANCDPSIEPGDAVVVADNRGNTYVSYVTSVSLRVNGGMSVRCSAKSASRNSAVTASATTKAIVEARNAIRAERSERERAMAEFKEASTGLYSTDQKLEDGSVVHFLHDKPTIAASRIIWKMTAEAVAVSTDGGKTYATGLSADGTAVLNRLYAIGINADYITAGRISDQDDASWWDLTSGQFVTKDMNAVNLTATGEVAIKPGSSDEAAYKNYRVALDGVYGLFGKIGDKTNWRVYYDPAAKALYIGDAGYGSDGIRHMQLIANDVSVSSQNGYCNIGSLKGKTRMSGGGGVEITAGNKEVRIGSDLDTVRIGPIKFRKSAVYASENKPAMNGTWDLTLNGKTTRLEWTNGLLTHISTT